MGLLESTVTTRRTTRTRTRTTECKAKGEAKRESQKRGNLCQVIPCTPFWPTNSTNFCELKVDDDTMTMTTRTTKTKGKGERKDEEESRCGRVQSKNSLVIPLVVSQLLRVYLTLQNWMITREHYESGISTRLLLLLLSQTNLQFNSFL
ncbi:hypothetical protein M0802_005272 [Mischocyttarus mexicanus]|nr:hypothetical protein M0802_005272 [Mischocyttarus mexicanus]